MPVTDQTTTNTYTGNGVTTVFAYDFKVLAEADLSVLVDGVEQTLTTHYTLSGIGASGGGNVTFVTAPATAAEVVITRAMDFTRATDYQDNGDLLASTLDEDVDRTVMLIQQLRQIINRSMRAPVAETSLSELPAVADRASLYLAFDASGQPVATAGTTSNIVVSTFAETLIDDADAAAMRATLGLVIGTNVQTYNTNLTTLGAGGAGARSFLGLAIGTDVQAYDANANRIVQVVEATPVSTVVTCSTAMPFDDTIPQNTEGDQVITVSITPTNALNRLRIEFLAPVVGNAGASNYAIAALFQDSTAGALAVAVSDVPSGNPNSSVALWHEMAAGATSATTFKVRVGGGTTLYVNGSSAGTRLFGGVSAVRLRVTEVRV